MTLRHGRTTVELILCRSCDAFVFPQTEICPHCQAEIVAEAGKYESAITEARAARDHLVAVLARHGVDAAQHPSDPGTQMSDQALDACSS